MSDERRARRRLMTLHKKGKLAQSDKEQFYTDWVGNEFKYAWQAKLSSFLKVVWGCVHNGFPVMLDKLWYNAWACWPFFFVRKDMEGDPIQILNHERIHCRQQWDIHVSIGVPFVIIIGLLNYMGIMDSFLPALIAPFIPTVLYGVEMMHSVANLIGRGEKNITLNLIRANTCFERESISKQLNTEYLSNRKFWAVLAYTGIPLFRNYGI